VTSHTELWEWNGNNHSHNSDTVMGMGREPGIFLRSLLLDHPSQLGPTLDIPLPSGPACLPATLPSPHHPTWNRGVSEDRKGPWKKILFWRGNILTSNRRKLTYTSPGGSLWEGEGNENYRNATIPVSIPGSIPGNYGKSHLCFWRSVPALENQNL